MKTESKHTISIAISGTLTIERGELESVLKDIIAQKRDCQPRHDQPTPDVAGERPQRVAFSVDETAELLGVSSSSIWRLLRRGLLKRSKALRHRRIAKSEVERFLKETSNVEV